MSADTLEDRAVVELIPFFAIVLYLIPFCVAALRNHEQATGVLLLNLLTGWTVVGWWAALIWALAGGQREPGLPRGPGPGVGRPVMPRILDNPTGRDGL
jgi:hypothetical protein